MVQVRKSCVSLYRILSPMFQSELLPPPLPVPAAPPPERETL